MKLEQAFFLSEEEGSLNKKEDPKISVYGSEGNEPHLHYYFKNGKQGCVRLDIPKYFCHENHHEGMNTVEKKIFLITIKNIWNRCVEFWNKDSKQEKLICKMPDYRLLPNLQPNGKLAKEDRK